MCVYPLDNVKDCAEFNNGLDSTELSNYLNPVDRAGAVGSGRFHYASVLGHLALRWPCWRGFLVDGESYPRFKCCVMEGLGYDSI